MKYLTISDYIWQYLTIFNNIWQYLTISDNIWQYLTIFDIIWPFQTQYIKSPYLQQDWLIHDKLLLSRKFLITPRQRDRQRERFVLFVEELSLLKISRYEQGEYGYGLLFKLKCQFFVMFYSIVPLSILLHKRTFQVVLGSIY